MSADHKPRYDSEHALGLLKDGNKAYLAGRTSHNIGEERRLKTASEGQFPYAIVITCSDSRVIPEIIFSAGIGDLFVIRTAGNTVDNCSLGSIEYAVSHLGCRLAVVMGHTHCGAINAALTGRHEGHIGFITEEIRRNIGDDADAHTACIDNIRNSIRVITGDLPDFPGFRCIGAFYDIEKGTVEFME